MISMRADGERPRIAVVGIGDDGAAGLTARARALVEAAELLVGGRRHLAFFPGHPAERVVLANDVERALRDVCARIGGRRCVVLASGDPCFFGIGPTIVELFGAETVEIVPSASSVSLAFARLGMGWQDASVESAHGRPPEAAVRAVLRSRLTALLTDSVNTPAALARALLAAGAADAEAWVLERLGSECERVVHGRLEELVGQSFDPLNVMIVRRAAGRVAGARFGRSEDELRHARGQITKAEARAVALARLELPSEGVLWDIGAGSGAISIEAAELAPRLRVLAVERSEEQLGCLRQNLTAQHAASVRVVAGEAPGALADLPDPDRVFLGGHGGQLGAILAHCLERLRPAGRLVGSFATLEAAGMATSTLSDRDWAWELCQVQASRGRRIGNQTRLEAMNPVFVVSAWQEAIP
ncbi:MAG: precorrin-6y C5,15-methyltransferase (decarboxylating) subunit CbiE [Chloroflexi bacterium]|nr:precorrin-6y C5,15-methyltransferase (decarboxylating) subunit CbiE [Chloroflexota bacterium]